MLHFRTILLWLSFILLILQYFIDIRSNMVLGIVFRLLPSLFLLLWFLLTLFFREKLKINPLKTPPWVFFLINILRPLASLSIVLGAVFKIMHWPLGNAFLIAGIACMAVYSSILSKYAYSEPDHNPDILDDMNE